MFNIGMENKPYEYTIKHDGIRAPYVSDYRVELILSSPHSTILKTYLHLLLDI